MVIQVIERTPRGPSRGEQIGKALAGALEAGSKMYSKHQKEKGLEQAYENIEALYGNPELSEQEKLIGSYRQLAGIDPERANQFVGNLSRIGSRQEQFKNKILGEEAERNRLNQSIQNLQGLYSNPDLTDEQKVFGVYQELANNPTLANNLLGSLQKPVKARGEDIAGEQYSKGYDAIIEGDNEAFRDVLEDENTPLNVKKQLTDLKNKQETRKSVQAKELRARQTLVQRSYKQAIDAERNMFKIDPYMKDSEKAAINKKIKRLEILQKNDLKRLSKNPNSYEKLALWSNVDEDFLPEEEEEVEEMESEFMEPEEKPKEEKKKPKFDSKNPAHMARMKRALQEAGGDKVKANQILAEEFSP